MSNVLRRVNRGPAAGPDNHQAIVNAARKIFRERGSNVPLSAIAKAAGVSQGVMYRHFRDLTSLAYAVFEENFTRLGTLAANPEPQAIFPLWDCLISYAVLDTAFVDLVVAAPLSEPPYLGYQRLLQVIQEPLQRAQAAGLVADNLSPEKLFTGWQMAYGIAVLTARGARDPLAVQQLLSLEKLGALTA